MFLSVDPLNHEIYTFCCEILLFFLLIKILESNPFLKYRSVCWVVGIVLLTRQIEVLPSLKTSNIRSYIREIKNFFTDHFIDVPLLYLDSKTTFSINSLIPFFFLFCGLSFTFLSLYESRCVY